MVGNDGGLAATSSDRVDASRISAQSVSQVDASTLADVIQVDDRIARPTQDAVRPEVLTGVVALNAAPWAQVKLGRRLLGNTPLRRVSLPIGKARLTFSCPPLGREAIVTVDVTDEARSVFVDLTVDPPVITVR